MQLDRSQKSALRDIEHDLYLSASAGTGKTEVLTRRFLSLLEEKRIDVSAILTITFTEKAASEMKRRIFDLILSKYKSATNNDEYNYWKKVKRDFVYASISTIHSFCASIIREYAYDIGIDPDFAIVEEGHIKFELRKWIKRQFIKNIENNDKVLHSLLNQYSFNELLSIIDYFFLNNHYINSHIIPLYEEKLEDSNSYYNFLVLGLREEKKNILKRFIDLKGDIADSYILWNRHKEELRAYIEDFKKRKSSKKDVIEKLDNVIQALFSEDPLSYEECSYEFLEPIYKYFPDPEPKRPKEAKTINENLGKRDHKREYFLHNFVYNFLSELRWRLPEHVFRLAQYDFDEIKKTYSVIKDLIHIYKNVRISIMSSPRGASLLYKWLSGYLLSYDDLESYALELLENNSFVVRELQNRIKYVMVDEAQDIDHIQKNIIEALVYSNSNPANARPNLFLVGDEKQSIYKFRGANISEFRNLRDKIETYKYLKTSYRSNKEIIGFVNTAFSSLFRHSYEDFEALYNEVSHSEKDSNEQKIKDARVELLLLHSKDSKKDSKEDSEGASRGASEKGGEAINIANRIIALVNEGRKYCDIAILFRAFTDIDIYTKALRERSIPYYVVDTRGFYENKEIVDCLNLLKFLDDNSSDIALCGLLRSPFCGVSDETLFYLTFNEAGNKQGLVRGFYNYSKNTLISSSERKKLSTFLKLLSDLSLKKDRLRVDNILKYAIDNSLYIPSIISKSNGGEIKHNLETFLLKLRNIELSQYNWSLRELINFIENVDKDDNIASEDILTEQNKVIIMTIHKAKGMEFPVVIVPNIERQNIVQRKSSIIMDKNYGLALRTLSLNDGESLADNFLYSYLKENDKRKEIAESKRILYVALTRAKDYLIISGKLPLALPKSLFDLRTTTSWMDYILNVLFNGSYSFLEWANECNNLATISAHKTFTLDKCKLIASYNYPHQDDKGNKDPALSPYAYVLPVDLVISKSRNIMLDRISATSLLVYKKCLRKFYYKFILEIAESTEEIGPYNKDILLDDEDIADENKADIPLSFIGNMVHKVLESYTNSSSVEDVLLICLKLDKLSKSLDEDSEYKVIEELKTLLDNFTSSSFYKEMESSLMSSYNELSFSYCIEDMLLEGSIDKIYKDKSSLVHIIDYKTNHFSKNANIEKQLTKKNNLYRVQMEIYWFIVNLLFLNESGNLRASLYYFDINKPVELLSSNKLNQARIGSSISSFISELKANLSSTNPPLSVFHTRSASKQDCQFCGYFMCENKS